MTDGVYSAIKPVTDPPLHATTVPRRTTTRVARLPAVEVGRHPRERTRRTDSADVVEIPEQGRDARRRADNLETDVRAWSAFYGRAVSGVRTRTCLTAAVCAHYCRTVNEVIDRVISVSHHFSTVSPEGV